jgi:serine O-acetyltransferase
MIMSRGDYLRYLEADRVALGRRKMRFVDRMVQVLAPDYVWKFQRLLRRLEYHKNVKNEGWLNKLTYVYLKLQFRKLSLKLGFSIPENVFGPGLAIVHYGTIVVNQNARVGSNCRIHVDTNIGASGGKDEAPQIGDNVYIAPGVKIVGHVKIASNTAIGANAVVNRSFTQEHTLIAGVPAKMIKPVVIAEIIKHI